jgi:chromosome segregation ATPase
MIEWNLITDMLNKLKTKIRKDGHDLPEDILKHADEKADSIFNPIEALGAEQVKVYNEFKALKAELDEDVKEATEYKNKLEKKFAKVKNLESFFTSSIELKHDLSNKMWRVNERTGMVEVFDQERAIKEMKEMGFGEIIPPNMFGGSDDK